MNNALKIFSEINYVLDMFNPLSHYGKVYKHSISYFNSIEELNNEFDLIDIVLNNIFDNEFNANKIQYHLARIPQLPDFKEQYTSIELFRFKKFLINYSAINKLINKNVEENFSFTFGLDELKNTLDIEEKDEETFYINESYSEDLRLIRTEIYKINKELSQLKDLTHKNLLKKHNLDFRFRDFVLVNTNIARDYDSDEIYVEPYDNKHLVVKPVYGKSFVELTTKKESLFVNEKQIESEIIYNISQVINENRKLLTSKIESVLLFDKIFAKAELAKKTNSVRPSFSKNNCIKLRQGRLLALENRCTKREISYKSLDLTLEKNVNVLHGSNMSGKTVTLQTLSFFQVLTQLGFFVPADIFITHLFDSIFYIGENFEAKTDGLSSFGIEIEQLINAMKNNGMKKLLILDEPARTTNSNEAVALLSAMIDHFNNNEDIQTMLSTHYTNLPRLNNVDYFKMKGINWSELNQENSQTESNLLKDKISLIHNNITYEVEKEFDDVQKNNDAIKIAKILGLDENIIKLTKKYIEDGDEKL